MTLTAIGTPARLEKQFLFIAIVITLVLAVFGSLFPRESLGAVRVWIDSRTYNHCFLVLPLALFLVWERRNRLAEISVVPDFRAAALIFVLGLVSVAASTAGILEAQQFVVLTMVQATLLGVLGARLYPALLAPLLYLYFLVPSGAVLVPALQTFTARFAVAGLHVLGIPVFSTGALIEIPAGTFAVAEACAGLRFLIAAVAFGVFFAILTYRSWIRRASFIAICVIVPVIANGLRALGLIAAAEWIGSASAALADHVLYGWIFFSLVLLALILIGRSFADEENVEAAPAPALLQLPARKIAWVGLSCAAAALLAPLLALGANGTESRKSPDAPPRVSQPWLEAVADTGWRPVVLSPTRAFRDAYTDGHVRLERFIAVYDWPDRARRIVRSDNRDADEKEWRFNFDHRVRLLVHGLSVPVRLSNWVKGPKSRFVWSFYSINGSPAANQWDAKWKQLQAFLSPRKCAAAYVAVSIESADERSADRSVERFLQANQPLREYLCAPA